MEWSAGIVCGAKLRVALDAVAQAARRDRDVLLTGESGTGKEIAARVFHEEGPRKKERFVAVNCATIPEGLAERLLFGAKKGAYSSATADAEGYMQSADGGVLFLDELGELDLGVQAKLLRVLETREVMALGATAARKIDVRICAATNRDLRAEVAAGRFRADLLYRLSQEVALPPLRERIEEIPWYIARASSLPPHGKLVEACLLRPWPGNVRELVREIQIACDGASDDKALRPEHLRASAGEIVGAPDPVGELTQERIESALKANGGNVTAAARALGLHRTQLYREMKRLGVTPKDDS
jgi:DNA-binding NtrC family response regulator